MAVSVWEGCSNLINWYYDSLRVTFTDWTAGIHDKAPNDGQRQSELISCIKRQNWICEAGLKENAHE